MFRQSLNLLLFALTLGQFAWAGVFSSTGIYRSEGESGGGNEFPCVVDLAALSPAGNKQANPEKREPKRELVSIGRAKKILTELGYKDLKYFGHGAQGVVFYAITPEGKPKALKIVKRKKKDTSQTQRLDFMKHEAQVMRYLHSKDPRFVDGEFKVVSNGNAEEVIFLEMDPIEENGKPAKNLHDLMNDEVGYFTPDNYKKIRDQLASLAQKAAELGVQHIDLKTNNILIKRDKNGEPTVYIMDWGLAYWDQQPEESPPARLTLYGTKGYIPPERYKAVFNSNLSAERRIQDIQRADVYAMRHIYWRMAYLSQNYKNEQGLISYRTYTPRKLTEEERKHQMINPVDTSGFSDSGYSQPGHSHSGKTEKESAVRLAEWSRWPNSISEQTQLIHQAETTSPEDFFKGFGKRLLELDARISHVDPDFPHREAALEILSNEALIIKMFEFKEDKSALGLTPSETKTLIQAITEVFVEAGPFLDNLTQVGPNDPAAELFYDKYTDEYIKYRQSKQWRSSQ